MKEKITPPRWAIRLFRWFCNDHLSEAVLGDMIELYERRVKSVGKLKSDLLFTWNVIQFIQPFAISKRSGSTPLNTFDMIANYFKIAWRNMLRHKLYTGITVGGFALGLATCMVIFLFVRNELSFDSHYKDTTRIFRLYNDYSGPGGDKWTNMPTPLTAVIKQDLPEIELAGRIQDARNETLVRRDESPDNTFEAKMAYADPEILQILEVPMIFGSSESALDQKYSVVISRRKSIQYFGDENPTGKILILNDDKSRPWIIGGVMEDFLPNTHFQYDFLLSLKDFEFWTGEQTDWCCWNYISYIKLREGVDPIAFEKKMIPVRDNYVVAYMERMGNQSAKDFQEHHSFRLQGVSDIYLHPEIKASQGDITYVWLFSCIATVILILACINFVNLSTAKSTKRAKEVGLRKVVGSARSSLITQFLTESITYSIVSFILAVTIVWITLPAFNLVANRSLSIPWLSWWLLPSLVIAAFVIGIVAGIYPSFYLSSFRSIDVIKGTMITGRKGSFVKSSMVVFQFTTSIMLIIGTVVIYNQMSFMMRKDVGFDKEQVMLIEGTNTMGPKNLVFKEDLLKLADVERASISGYLPVSGTNREGYGFFREGREKEDEATNAQKWRVDPDYISTMRMNLVEGRDFMPGVPSDSQAVIINQVMARSMGLENKAIGQRITNGNVYTIIGVVEDFNFASMKEPIRPLCFIQEGWGDAIISVRVNSSDLPRVIGSINRVWNKFMPHQPFRYSFLDERFALMYDDVLRMGRIFASFATLAIIVACLGLFALSAFMIEQRSKEISIRLVLGAPVNAILGLLTSGFIKLVMLSLLIAVPLGWYGMSKWLEDYDYRTPITWDVFALSGGIALTIAVVTIAGQSIKAARTNPVVNLRQ